MYWRSRNTPVGVAAPGQITPQGLLSRPSCETTRKVGTSTIVGGIIKVAMISTNTVVAAAEVVLGQRERRHRVDHQHDDRRDAGDEHAVPQVAAEVELRGTGRRSCSRRSANSRTGSRSSMLTLDRSRPVRAGRPSAPGCRRGGPAPAPARCRPPCGTRNSGSGSSWPSTVGGDLAVGQQAGRELEQLGLGLERGQRQPEHRAEHQHDAEQQVGVASASRSSAAGRRPRVRVRKAIRPAAPAALAT